MGVITTADKKVDEVKDKLTESINILHELVDGEVWGTSDYSKEYLDKLENLYLELRKLRKTI